MEAVVHNVQVHARPWQNYAVELNQCGTIGDQTVSLAEQVSKLFILLCSFAESLRCSQCASLCGPVRTAQQVGEAASFSVTALGVYACLFADL